MKAVRFLAGLALVVGLAGCGASDKDAAKAPVMPDVIGERLDVAKSDIERAGFEGDVEVLSTGTFGVVKESNWTVCEQSPAAGKAIKTPRLTVDRSCNTAADNVDGSSTTTTAPPATASTTTKPPTTTAPKPQEVLTPQNNADLAAVLAETDNCSDKIQAFAAKYSGRTIEFDGNIATLNNHGTYTTRYDILVTAGDYSETSQVGPTFQFRDVAIFDLHLAGSNIPDSLTPGVNLHVKAKVGSYESSSCLFLLQPISTTVR